LRLLPARRRDRAARRYLAVARAAARSGAALMSAFFSISGVSKRFRGLVAVDRASCEVARGEIFAVIGPHGAGKATLFNMIATAPQLLLLDEVMAGLRPTETDRVVAILRELNAQGLTILLIEHVMRAVMALASQVLVLHHGAPIALGSPADVVREPAVISSYL